MKYGTLEETQAVVRKLRTDGLLETKAELNRALERNRLTKELFRLMPPNVLADSEIKDHLAEFEGDYEQRKMRLELVEAELAARRAREKALRAELTELGLSPAGWQHLRELGVCVEEVCND